MEAGEAVSGGAVELADRVCCMCGDIGFPDALLRCPRCRCRLQHTYCSRFYPDKIDMETWGCEWCVHGQQQRHQEEGEQTPSKKAHVKGGGGGVVGPRRSSRAVDRWRKLARAAKLGSGRRYKLLADVLCS